jgi:hypothetical protein
VKAISEANCDAGAAAELSEYMDFWKYGEAAQKLENAAKTPYGFLRRKDLGPLLAPEPARQAGFEQRM